MSANATFQSPCRHPGFERNRLFTTIILDMPASANQNSRCDVIETPSGSCRGGTGLWRNQNLLCVSRTSDARFRFELGLAVCGSRRSEVVEPISQPQDQSPSSGLVFEGLSPLRQTNYTGLESNRGTSKRSIGRHFRQHSRGRKRQRALYDYRV